MSSTRTRSTGPLCAVRDSELRGRRRSLTALAATEIIAFHDRLKEFEALNCAVVGFSVDSVDSHRAWTQSPRTAGGLGGALAYPLVSDVSQDISRKYGCLWKHGWTPRALYIIDGHFKIRHVCVRNG